MRLSRTDLVPVLAIVAGGLIGASLSFSFLGQSPADDVLVPDQVVVPSPTLQTVWIEVLPVRIEVPPVRIEVPPIRIEVPPIRIEVPLIRFSRVGSPNEQWILCRDPDTDELTRFEVRTDRGAPETCRR